MDSPLADLALLALRFVEGCLLLAVGFRLAGRRDGLSHAAGFGLACAATLVVFPVARGHYFVLYFPAVVFVGMWLLRAGRARLAAAFAIAPAALVIAHYALMPITGRIGLLGLGTAVWYTSVAITILRTAPSKATTASLADESLVELPLAA